MKFTASSSNTWLPSHNIVDSLNQVMDSVSVLSDTELQKELSIFANAQFTYDIAPGVALGEDGGGGGANKNDHRHNVTNQQQFRRESSSNNNKQPNMHSLLNVKLASLVDNNDYHTTMTPDAIESYYDQSPDYSPPNGYHSPNPSPPNGFHSPNPTPPNGYLANSPAIYQGIQGIVNPPITFYGEDTVMGYDEDQFMKTMRILTTSYNDPPQQQYDQLENMNQHRPSAPATSVEKTTKNNKSASSTSPTERTKQRRKNSVSVSTVKKSSPLVNNDYVASIESEDEDDDNFTTNEDTEDGGGKKQQQPVLTKEDKRRRNTAASARFRVKKKLREQALQQTANEMTEKANAFENRVHELEREVKWLKALIVERKNGQLEQMLMKQHQQHQQQQQQHLDMNHHHRGSSTMNNNNYMSQHQQLRQQHQHI